MNNVVDSIVKQMKGGKKVKNKVVFLIDESGSMNDYKDKATSVFNEWIRKVETEAVNKNQETDITVLLFQSLYKPQVVQKLIGNRLTALNYNPYSMTPLYDAVGRSIEYLDIANEANLVITITDGKENESLSETSQTISDKISHLEKNGNYSFIFLVPKYCKMSTARQFGVSADNILEWETSERGLERTRVVTTSAISSYYDDRTRGETQTKSFFVTTDLSKVDNKKLDKELEDLSDKFKLYNVEKETEIKTFYEYKTGKIYTVGTTYYQLMKKEYIESNKRVMVMDKTSKKIWGGQEARELLGLPDDKKARVTPGNHQNYDIFVQSLSVNRKLPRGTKVLIRV